MALTVTCVKKHVNKHIEVGKTYPIIDADMEEYLIEINKDKEIWISKNDIEHFKYSV